MYFHTFSFLGSVVPLCLGYPQPAVLPSPVQAVLLLLLAACSFTANLLVNRAFQIELAAKASAVNFSQVGKKHKGTGAADSLLHYLQARQTLTGMLPTAACRSSLPGR